MGGRGGSSGLSAGSEKLPRLEGSEKQVAWAEDIRNDSIEYLKTHSDSVVNYQDLVNKYNDFKETVDNSNMSSADLEKDRNFTRRIAEAQTAERTFESVINGQNRDKYDYDSEMSYTRQVKNKFKDPIEKTRKKGMSSEEKREYKEKIRNAEKEYRKWLVNEVWKIYKSKKSAKWWIENR